MVRRAADFLNEGRAAGKKMGNTPSGKQGDVGKPYISRHNFEEREVGEESASDGARV